MIIYVHVILTIINIQKPYCMFFFYTITSNLYYQENCKGYL